MNSQQSYREGTVRGANPVELVVRLYEQMIEDLRQVAKAIEQNNVERRTQRVNHVILVIGHLQSSLDFANGGKVAKNLDNLYNVLRQNLIQVQFHPSKRAVAQLITDLLMLREAWIQVERAENPSVTTEAVATAASMVPFGSDPDSDSDRGHADWQG
jgi:flagellar protein FliS